MLPNTNPAESLHSSSNAVPADVRSTVSPFFKFLVVVYALITVFGMGSGIFTCGFYGDSDSCAFLTIIPGFASLLLAFLIPMTFRFFPKIARVLNLVLLLAFLAFFGGRWFLENLPAEQKYQYVYGYESIANCQNNDPAYPISYRYDQQYCFNYFAKKENKPELCLSISNTYPRSDCLDSFKPREESALTPEFCERYVTGQTDSYNDQESRSDRDYCMLQIEQARQSAEVAAVDSGQMSPDDILKRCNAMPYSNRSQDLEKFQCYLNYIGISKQGINISQYTCSDSHPAGPVRDICHLDQGTFVNVNGRRMAPAEACKQIENGDIRDFCDVTRTHYGL